MQEALAEVHGLLMRSEGRLLITELPFLGSVAWCAGRGGGSEEARAGDS